LKQKEHEEGDPDREEEIIVPGDHTEISVDAKTKNIAGGLYRNTVESQNQLNYGGK